MEVDSFVADDSLQIGGTGTLRQEWTNRSRMELSRKRGMMGTDPAVGGSSTSTRVEIFCYSESDQC